MVGDAGGESEGREEFLDPGQDGCGDDPPASSPVYREDEPVPSDDLFTLSSLSEILKQSHAPYHGIFYRQGQAGV